MEEVRNGGGSGTEEGRSARSRSASEEDSE
jgi:hypothetical protein